MRQATLIGDNVPVHIKLVLQALDLSMTVLAGRKLAIFILCGFSSVTLQVCPTLGLACVLRVCEVGDILLTLRYSRVVLAA